PELIPSEYYFSSELTPIDEVQFPLNTMHQGKNYNKIEFNQPSLDSSYIYIYMNESRFGYRSLFKLVIGKANSNEKMILYVRKSSIVLGGETIRFFDIEFNEGIYFFDECITHKKYHSIIREIKPSELNSEFGYEINFLKEHKISEKELNEILIESECNE
ncbi:MAG: hypothetical protein Q8K02_17160, partial [Flavobacterium sp.]|nr:hypothetical protein [Flavobacterium sp.]